VGRKGSDDFLEAAPTAAPMYRCPGMDRRTPVRPVPAADQSTALVRMAANWSDASVEVAAADAGCRTGSASCLGGKELRGRAARHVEVDFEEEVDLGRTGRRTAAMDRGRYHLGSSRWMMSIVCLCVAQ
jgi:hypothetical protein